MAVVGDRRAGCSEQFDDAGFPIGLLHKPLARALAFLDEVRADERHVILAGLRPFEFAVNEYDGDARILRRLQRPFVAFGLARSEEDCVHALRYKVFKVRDLRGRVAARVREYEFVAALGGLVLHALRLGDAPRPVRLGLRESDAHLSALAADARAALLLAATAERQKPERERERDGEDMPPSVNE